MLTEITLTHLLHDLFQPAVVKGMHVKEAESYRVVFAGNAAQKLNLTSDRTEGSIDFYGSEPGPDGARRHLKNAPGDRNPIQAGRYLLCANDEGDRALFRDAYARRAAGKPAVLWNLHARASMSSEADSIKLAEGHVSTMSLSLGGSPAAVRT